LGDGRPTTERVERRTPTDLRIIALELDKVIPRERDAAALRHEGGELRRLGWVHLLDLGGHEDASEPEHAQLALHGVHVVVVAQCVELGTALGCSLAQKHLRVLVGEVGCLALQREVRGDLHDPVPGEAELLVRGRGRRRQHVQVVGNRVGRLGGAQFTQRGHGRLRHERRRRGRLVRLAKRRGRRGRARRRQRQLLVRHLLLPHAQHRHEVGVHRAGRSRASLCRLFPCPSRGGASRQAVGRRSAVPERSAAEMERGMPACLPRFPACLASLRPCRLPSSPFLPSLPSVASSTPTTPSNTAAISLAREG
jgi:hypothetical protein